MHPNCKCFVYSGTKFSWLRPELMDNFFFFISLAKLLESTIVIWGRMEISYLIWFHNLLQSAVFFKVLIKGFSVVLAPVLAKGYLNSFPKFRLAFHFFMLALHVGSYPLLFCICSVYHLALQVANMLWHSWLPNWGGEKEVCFTSMVMRSHTFLID